MLSVLLPVPSSVHLLAALLLSGFDYKFCSQVTPKQHEVKFNGPMQNVTLPAYSLTIVSIDTSSPRITLA